MRVSVKWAIAGLILVGVILAIVLPLVAESTLQPTEVGLSYNYLNKKIDESTLYRQGRYTIGVSNYFIKYNIDLKTLTLTDLPCRTSDGLQITLSASLQYRIKNDDVSNIVNLFYNFPWNTEEGGFRSLVTSTLRQSAAQFEAPVYVSNRAGVESSIGAKIVQKLNDYQAVAQNFQLLSIVFPSDFQAAIDQAQKLQMQLVDAQVNLQRAKQQGALKLQQAQLDSQTIASQAALNASSYYAQTLQLNTSISSRIFGSALALSTIQKTLNLTADDLTAFAWQESINNILSSNDNATHGSPQIPIAMPAPDYFECLYNSQQACPS